MFCVTVLKILSYIIKHNLIYLLNPMEAKDLMVTLSSNYSRSYTQSIESAAYKHANSYMKMELCVCIPIRVDEWRLRGVANPDRIQWLLTLAIQQQPLYMQQIQ